MKPNLQMYKPVTRKSQIPNLLTPTQINKLMLINSKYRNSETINR